MNLLPLAWNDAALCLAYHSGQKSLENFVQMMNDTAKKIGMNDTTFHNPSGLDEEDEGNISSVYDMALLMRYCMENETFRKITSTTTYQRLDGNGTWHNKNKLLTNYEYATGGKTGFTKKAKRTLVTSAKKENIELIIVTFNCGDDFNFHQNLYEIYFELYHQTLCLDKGIHQYEDYHFYVDKPVFQVLTENPNVKDFDYQVDTQENKMEVYYQNQYLGSYEIVQEDYLMRYFFEEML